jgi:hypothetical protein
MTFIRGAVQCSREACQSSNIDTSTFERMEGTEIAVLYCDTCRSCGCSGDFADLNLAILLAARHRSETKEIKAILLELAANHSQAAYIARVLEIPQTTVNGWLAEDGGHSPADLPLLRLIRTYPWLLRVAELDYAAGSTQVILLEQADLALQEAQKVVKTAEEKIK